MAEGIAFAFLGKVSEYLVAPIGRQFGYVFCYSENIEKMRSQFTKLEAKRHRVQLLVDQANNNCEIIGPDVEAWLKSVEEKKEEVDLILVGKENVGKGCLNECCLNMKSRYCLSRKSTKKTQDLVLLLAEGDFQRVAYPPPALGKVPTSIEDNKKTQHVVVEVQGDQKSDAASNTALISNLGVASTSTSNFGGLESRLAVMRNVMEAVRDDNILIIGICGMGGVGKTTMVHEVVKSAREELLFEEVVMTVVSQEPDVKSIQLGIADFLKLELHEHSSLARASRLHERLTQIGLNGKPKKILIILDDLWKKLDLKEVGIPFPDDHNGCKIVLTSRSIDVCAQMKTKTFPIHVLPEDEAWSLFQNSLQTAALYPVAKDIVKECGGLPIAITTIAMVLAEKEEDTWNYVLRQLNRSSLKGEYADVYKVFKVNYDNLSHEEIKDVFLLCCLFPEDYDIPIEDLVRNGMALRVFKKVYKLLEARENAYAHVGVLKKLNLLIDSEKAECIKMHDLVRDFGISIASEDKFMVRFDKGLKEWPMEDMCEQLTSISMQCDEMDELPNVLKYPNLKLLQLMGMNSSLFKFPQRLNEVMGELQVLTLRHLSVPSLSGSVEPLSNLRNLSLCCCNINGDVSMIGNIENLEILSFAGCDILELPRQIGKLSRLRLLDLTGCSNLQKIAPGVLSSLIRLEELYIRGTSIRWAKQIRENYVTLSGDDDEEEEVSDDEETYASFEELKQLSNLVAMDIRILDEFLPIDLENLEKFKISVGGEYEEDLGKVFVNTLLLVGDEIDPVKYLLKALCRKTEILCVQVKDLKNLGNEVERKDLIRLKCLVLNSCDELVSIFDGMNQSSTIHSSSLVLRPFGNLTHLKLTRCNKLKSVFSMSIARGLFNLESLKIFKCSYIEEIFSKERGDKDEKAVEFLKLEKLHLKGLPNLVSFCKAVDEVKFPQLKEMHLSGLPKFTSLYPEMKTPASDCHHAPTKHPFFHQKVRLNNMAELIISRMEGLILVWPAQTRDVSTCEPRKVKVWNCERLLNVFASNMSIQQLQNLESLEVEECRSLEVVFDIQGILNMHEGREVVALRQLTYLRLSQLPKLTHVWRRGPHITCHGFYNLKELEVINCHRLKSILSLSIARGMVMLETLIVRRSHMMEAIFSEETGRGDETSTAVDSKIEFPKLKTLRLETLPSLEDFCRFVDVVALPQLEKLYLRSLTKITGLYTGVKTLVSENPFFNQKVTLTKEVELELWGIGNMTTVFPANVIPQLQIVKTVRVQYCYSVEVVFDLKVSNLNEGHQQVDEFSQLKSIYLIELTKLTSIWKKGPCVILGFQNLKSLIVRDCYVLRHLLTPSMAKSLASLDLLDVQNCGILEAVVAKEEGEEEEECTIEEAILFPILRTLHLSKLPNLLTVFPKPYSFNWSSLECIEVEEEMSHLLRRPN